MPVVRSGTPEMVKLLLDNGASPHTKTPRLMHDSKGSGTWQDATSLMQALPNAADDAKEIERRTAISVHIHKAAETPAATRKSEL